MHKKCMVGIKKQAGRWASCPRPIAILWSQGVEPHPGPLSKMIQALKNQLRSRRTAVDDKSPKPFTIATQNVDKSLSKRIDRIIAGGDDVICIQEAQTPEAQVPFLKAYAKKNGYVLHFGQ